MKVGKRVLRKAKRNRNVWAERFKRAGRGGRSDRLRRAVLRHLARDRDEDSASLR